MQYVLTMHMFTDQYTQKKIKKNSRTLCPKLPFSRIFQVQKESKNNSRNSRNSSTAGHHVNTNFTESCIVFNV